MCKWRGAEAEGVPCGLKHPERKANCSRRLNGKFQYSDIRATLSWECHCLPSQKSQAMSEYLVLMTRVTNGVGGKSGMFIALPPDLENYDMPP